MQPESRAGGEKGGPVSPNPLQEALGRQVSAWRNACPRARAPADAPTRARQGLRRGADVSHSARCRSHVQEHLPVRIPLDPARHNDNIAEVRGYRLRPATG